MNAQRNSGMDFSMLAGESFYPTSKASFGVFPHSHSTLSREISSSSSDIARSGKYQKMDTIRSLLHNPTFDLTTLTLCEECSVSMKKESQRILLELHKSLDAYKAFYDAAESIATANRKNGGQGGALISPVKARSPPRPVSRGVSFADSVEDNEALQNAQQELNKLKLQEEVLSQTIERYQQELQTLYNSATDNGRQSLDYNENEILEAYENLDEELRSADAVLKEILFFDAGNIRKHIDHDRSLLGLNHHQGTTMATTSSTQKATTTERRNLSILSPAFDAINIQCEWVEVNGLRLRSDAAPTIHLNWVEINRAWATTVSMLSMLRRLHTLSDEIRLSQSLSPLYREILRCFPTMALFNAHHHHHHPSSDPHHPYSHLPPSWQEDARTSPISTELLQFVPLHDRVLCTLTSKPPPVPHHHCQHQRHVGHNAGVTATLVLEGGIVTPISRLPPPPPIPLLQGAANDRPELSQYQRAVLWFILSVLVTKIEMEGVRSVLFPAEPWQSQLHSSSQGHIFSVALWELVVSAALGHTLGLDPLTPWEGVSTGHHRSPSTEEVNQFLAYLPLPRNESEFPDKLQIVLHFHRRYGLPATIWKILREPSYLNTVLFAAMKLLRDLTERPLSPSK